MWFNVAGLQVPGTCSFLRWNRRVLFSNAPCSLSLLKDMNVVRSFSFGAFPPAAVFFSGLGCGPHPHLTGSRKEPHMAASSSWRCLVIGSPARWFVGVRCWSACEARNPHLTGSGKGPFQAVAPSRDAPPLAARHLFPHLSLAQTDGGVVLRKTDRRSQPIQSPRGSMCTQPSGIADEQVIAA